jgi:hypothetical protein
MEIQHSEVENEDEDDWDKTYPCFGFSDGTLLKKRGRPSTLIGAARLSK